MSEIVVSNLPELARTINRAQQNVESLLTEALSHALEAGAALNEAKSLVQHGEWQSWLESNCAVSDRTARSYMRLAREIPLLPSEERQRVAILPLREAISALASPRAQGNDIEGAYLLGAPSHLCPDEGKSAIYVHIDDPWRGWTAIYRDKDHPDYFNIATWHITCDDDDAPESRVAGFWEYTARPISTEGILPYLEHFNIPAAPLDWMLVDGPFVCADLLAEDARAKYLKKNPWLKSA